MTERFDGLGIGHPRSRSSSAGSNLVGEVKRKKRPVDPRAKRRYEALWEKQIAAMYDKEEMPGLVVVRIWNRSGLPRDRLKEIWFASFFGCEAYRLTFI